MSFGKMRTLITIYAVNASIVDTHTVDSFLPILHVRGYVMHNTGRKFFEAGAINAEHIDTVIIRYRDEVTVECRLAYDGKMYRVESVMPLENRRMYLELKCRAITNG